MHSLRRNRTLAIRTTPLCVFAAAPYNVLLRQPFVTQAVRIAAERIAKEPPPANADHVPASGTHTGLTMALQSVLPADKTL